MSLLRSFVSQSSWFCSNTCFHSGHQQISNPIIPYVGPIISGGLKQGTALYIQGVVPDNAIQFSINLQTGQNKYDDIAFHFNSWIGQCIYLNSFQNGNWEVEERVPDESFSRGAAFNMFIVIKTDGYEVYVNDLKLYMFHHRIPLEKVTTLGICGDVSIEFFGLCENWRRPGFTAQAITSTGNSLSNMLPIPTEVSHQVIQPALPHMGNIRDRLKPGMAIFFQGALPAHSKEFEINLQTGQSDSDDIAFHFNPRIGQHVYLNSFRNGSWEEETCVSDELFTKGAAFYMFVVISSEGYEVYINGLQHCRFNHRIPLENVSTLSIYGDVTIPIYGFIDNWNNSFTFMDLLKITGMGSSFSSLLPSLSEVSHPVILPTLPYVGTIRGGIRPDMAVFFQGTIPSHAKRFAVNFQTGPSDNADIAFQFNPRIGQNVYLNSFRNASWETEETAPDKPFTKGAAFNMFIIISSEGYEVYTNGVQLCIFKHRIPIEKISTLAIFGDISVTIFGFIDNWSRSPICVDQSYAARQLSVPSEVSHPVMQPAIPYIGTIKEEIGQDMALWFHGEVSELGKSFEINLLTGDSNNDDIAFHICPQIGKSVALNSYINGSWQTEEYASDNLFTKGASFHLFLVINSEGYEVYVNKLQHCTYRHRIPLEKVSTLGIRGDVTIKYFGFVKNWSDSSIAVKLNEIKDMSINSGNETTVVMETDKIQENSIVVMEMDKIQDTSITSGNECIIVTETTETADMSVTTGTLINPPSEISRPISSSESAMVVEINVIQDESITSRSLIEIPSEISHPVTNPELPYVGEIPGGLQTDMAVLLQGSLPADAEKFTINFQTKESEGDNIVFHFNTQTGHLMALKRFRNSSLETEEQASVTVFTKEAAFNMFIVINSDEYEVFVNGLKQCTFKHHLPLKDVSTFGIFGDVDINYFGFVKNWSDSSMVVKMKDIQDISITTGDELSVVTERNEIQDTVITSGGESVIVTETTETQDMSVTSGILTETSHPISSPESAMVVEFNVIQEESIISRSLIEIPSEISHPITNPELPYVGEIPGGLQTDMAVLLQGSLPADAEKFTINFQTDESEGDNIVFHFNTQTGNLVAMKRFRNGSLETEEQASVTAFTKEAAFNMFIVINSDEYEVFVNGLKQCTFKHHIPLKDVSTFGIFGNVVINYFGFVENWSDSSMVVKMKDIQDTVITSGGECIVVTETTETQDMSVTSGILTDVPSEISHPISSPESNMLMDINIIQDITSGSLIKVPEILHPISNPELPYVGEIPGGLKTDMAVIFKGTLPADAEKFTVNFQAGESEGDEIAFHFNPQIGHLVALKSFRNGIWETEEQASVTAFAKESAFNMFIIINSEGYEVHVNGLKQCTLKYHIPLKDVSTLGILGDVIIDYFGFVENWSTSSLALETNKITEMQSTSMTLVTSDKLALPFVGTIPGGIRADMAVLFYGTVLADSKEFEIKFQTHQPSEEIAFTINPQIVRYLVLSSLRSGSWKSEDFPSDSGAAFNMFVVIRSDGFEVYVNGLQYCTFKHHAPVETISSLGIRGDVFINFIGFIDNWSSSSMVMDNIKITGMEGSCWRPLPIPSEVSHPVSNPTLPYVGVIPGNTRPDMAILFQGALPADANEFTINFQTGESDGDDIAFHINPKLGHYVALNSFRNGSWETEESVSDKPFTKGAGFNMFVVIKSESYEVYVNGLELCTFKHRIPLENISTLQLYGDVSINFIGFIETWSKFTFIIENNEITGMRSSSWRCSSHRMIRTSSGNF